MNKELILIREVTPDECNWLSRTYAEGEKVFGYFGHTYGCIANGVACTEEDGETPFFELPTNAVEKVSITLGLLTNTVEKVSITLGLPNVDNESNDKSRELKPEVEEILFREITTKEGIEFVSHSTGKGKVDLIKNKKTNQYGFAFACSKFDDNFKEDLRGRGYRYRDVEVKQAIRKMFQEIEGLDTKVKYDRGSGVFVWNIFIK